MAQASTLRTGYVVQMKGEFYKVLESDVHQGGGRMGMMVHTKLRNVITGSITEPRFEPKAEVEVLEVERIKMQFLYPEGDHFVFMNPESYDQVPISKTVIGSAASFIKEEDVVEVEFHEGKPLAIHFPPIVELTVMSTGAGIRGQSDSTYKDATLENGLDVLVPQFIKEGDRVRVEVETGKYLDRISK